MSDAFHMQVESSKPHWIDRVAAIEGYFWAYATRAERFALEQGVRDDMSCSHECLNPKPSSAPTTCEATHCDLDVPQDIGPSAYAAVYNLCREPTRCGGRLPVEFMLMHLQGVFSRWSELVLVRAGMVAADSSLSGSSGRATPDDHHHHNAPLSPTKGGGGSQPLSTWPLLFNVVRQYCFMRRSVKMMFLYADHNHKNCAQLLFRRCFRVQIQCAANDRILVKHLVRECITAARRNRSGSSSHPLDAFEILETLEDLSLTHVISTFIDSVTPPLQGMVQRKVQRFCDAANLNLPDICTTSSPLLQANNPNTISFSSFSTSTSDSDVDDHSFSKRIEDREDAGGGGGMQEPIRDDGAFFVAHEEEGCDDGDVADDVDGSGTRRRRRRQRMKGDVPDTVASSGVPFSTLPTSPTHECSETPPETSTVTKIGEFLDQLIDNLRVFLGIPRTRQASMRGRFAVLVAAVYRATAQGAQFKHLISSEVEALWSAPPTSVAIFKEEEATLGASQPLPPLLHHAAFSTGLFVCDPAPHPLVAIVAKDRDLFAVLLDVIQRVIHRDCEGALLQKGCEAIAATGAAAAGRDGVASPAEIARSSLPSAASGKQSPPSTSSKHDEFVRDGLRLYDSMVSIHLKCEAIGRALRKCSAANDGTHADGGDRCWPATALEAHTAQTLGRWMRAHEMPCANACAQGLLVALHAQRDAREVSRNASSSATSSDVQQRKVEEAFLERSLENFSHVACLLAPKDALMDCLVTEIASEALTMDHVLPGAGGGTWSLYAETLTNRLSGLLCHSLLTGPLALVRDLNGAISGDLKPRASSAAVAYRSGPLSMHRTSSPASSTASSGAKQSIPLKPIELSLTALCVARWSNVVHTPLAIKTADLGDYLGPAYPVEVAMSLVSEAKKAEKVDTRQLQWLLHAGTMTAEMTLPSWGAMPMTFTATPWCVLALACIFNRGGQHHQSSQHQLHSPTGGGSSTTKGASPQQHPPIPLEGLAASIRVPLSLLQVFCRWLECEGLLQCSKDARAVRMAPSPPYKRKLPSYVVSTRETQLHYDDHQQRVGGGSGATGGGDDDSVSSNKGGIVGSGIIPERLVVARVRHMEAVIVRIMKGSGCLPHDQLLERTLREMGRVAQMTVAQFKVCVGGLIQREFLRRDEGEMTMYTYCA